VLNYLMPQHAGTADVAGGGHPGDQLGDDQLLALQVPPAHEQDRQTPLFKALWYPYGNYVCLAFVAFILGVMLLIRASDLGVRDSGVGRVHVGLLRDQEQTRCAAGAARGSASK
jgi:hypothetical protein